MPAFIITRIQVGDYDTWRPMFDQDKPRAREKAKVQRVYRDADDANHIFIFLEFASLDDANEARRRLVESGALNRFEGRKLLGPTSFKRLVSSDISERSPMARCFSQMWRVSCDAR